MILIGCWWNIKSVLRFHNNVNYCIIHIIDKFLKNKLLIITDDLDLTGSDWPVPKIPSSFVIQTSKLYYSPKTGFLATWLNYADNDLWCEMKERLNNCAMLSNSLEEAELTW